MTCWVCLSGARAAAAMLSRLQAAAERARAARQPVRPAQLLPRARCCCRGRAAVSRLPWRPARRMRGWPEGEAAA